MRREIDVSLLTNKHFYYPDRILLATSMFADADGWCSMRPAKLCHVIKMEFTNGDPDKETLSVCRSRLLKDKYLEKERISGTRYYKYRLARSEKEEVNEVAQTMDAARVRAILKKHLPLLPEIYISAHRNPMEFFNRPGCEYLRDFTNSEAVVFWSKSFPTAVNKNPHLKTYYTDERVRLQGAVLGLTDFYETVYLVGNSDEKRKRQQELQKKGGGWALNGMLKSCTGESGDRVEFLSPKAVASNLALWDAGMKDEKGIPVKTIKASAFAISAESTKTTGANGQIPEDYDLTGDIQ